MRGDTSNSIWIPYYPGDHLRDTGRLNTTLHGAYWLLLSDYYSNQSPLPDDDDQLAAITKMSLREFKRVRHILESFFQIRDGLWFHKRCDQELGNRVRVSTRRRINGSKGGQTFKQNQSKLRANALKPTEQKETQPQPQPQPSPTTDIHTHSESHFEPPSGGKVEGMEPDPAGAIGGGGDVNCPPSKTEVLDYAKKSVPPIPEATALDFYDHWQSRHWMINDRVYMADYRPALDKWHRKNLRSNPMAGGATTFASPASVRIGLENQLEALRARWATHPANPESVSGVADPSPEQNAAGAELRAMIREIRTKLSAARD